MTIWRTELVIDMCQSMRETHDYTAAPILADALEEAGYTDGTILQELRSPRLHPIDAQRLVALVYSYESAAAVNGIEGIANSLGPGAIYELGEERGSSQEMTYHRLMAAAMRWVANDDPTTEYGTEDWRDQFAAEEFWMCYEKVTGRRVEDAPNFFRCAC